MSSAQQSVLALAPGQSRAIVGAPGSGKTHALLELYASLLRDRGFSDSEVLVLGVNRLTAARLRAQLDERLADPAGSPRVRTSSSLALAVVSADRSSKGELPLRLLTGAVQDEIVEATVERFLEKTTNTVLGRDVLMSPVFRNQFRELVRVLNNYALTASDLAKFARVHDVPEWAEAAELIAHYRDELERSYPLHRDVSALHAEAVKVLNEISVSPAAADRIGDLAKLRVILVDDAQELTESSVSLLRAFAARGVTVWAFGDPDTSTGAFQGAAHRVLSDLGAALGVTAAPPIVLTEVHRHPTLLRGLVTQYAQHIGTAGLGQQRTAVTSSGEGGRVQYAKFGSGSEASGAIAHLLRQRHLGLAQEPGVAAEPVLWSEMAVICRTRQEAKKLAQQLAAAQVPTDISAGGTVLTEHTVVRHLLLLTQLAFGWREASADDVEGLLVGPFAGLDPLGVKRLRTVLQLAAAREGEPRSSDELLLDVFAHPTNDLGVDTRQSRALASLAKTAAAGRTAQQEGGDLSEVLWALWEASALPKKWEKQALENRGRAAEEANRALDAVMALFFAAARFEEQETELDRRGFVESLMQSSLPEDSLARAAQREAVTVTTPQGMIGRSAKIVVVAQLQDGVWPNLKSRGSILHLERLVNVARGFPETPPTDRRDVLHDELRMLVQAISRAEQEVLFTAVQNDDTMPSMFFSSAEPAELPELPTSRLTLRGLVAALRRRLHEHPENVDAARELALLAAYEVPGAHPDDWYGVLPTTTDQPLADLTDDEATVSVSPSRLANFEECPLNWAISTLGGDRTFSSAALGTLLHLAMETVPEPSFDAIMARVDSGWTLLNFDAPWESERSHKTAEAMAASLAGYLGEFEAKGGEVVSAEQEFELAYGHARVRGVIDRIELLPTAGDEPAKVLIVDLKTQKRVPSATEIEQHPQLAVYQLAVQQNQIASGEYDFAGAALLLVHPKAVGKQLYKLPVQRPLDEVERTDFIHRIQAAALGMSEASFTAQVEHHCSDPYAPGNCKIHVIKAVSQP